MEDILLSPRVVVRLVAPSLVLVAQTSLQLDQELVEYLAKALNHK